MKEKINLKKYIVLDCSTEQISNSSDSIVLRETFGGYNAYEHAKKYIKDLVLKIKEENADILCQIEEDFYSESYTAGLVRGTTVVKIFTIVKLDFRVDLPY